MLTDLPAEILLDICGYLPCDSPALVQLRGTSRLIKSAADDNIGCFLRFNLGAENDMIMIVGPNRVPMSSTVLERVQEIEGLEFWLSKVRTMTFTDLSHGDGDRAKQFAGLLERVLGYFESSKYGIPAFNMFIKALKMGSPESYDIIRRINDSPLNCRVSLQTYGPSATGEDAVFDVQMPTFLGKKFVELDFAMFGNEFTIPYEMSEACEVQDMKIKSYKEHPFMDMISVVENANTCNLLKNLTWSTMNLKLDRTSNIRNLALPNVQVLDLQDCKLHIEDGIKVRRRGTCSAREIKLSNQDPRMLGLFDFPNVTKLFYLHNAKAPVQASRYLDHIVGQLESLTIQCSMSETYNIFSTSSFASSSITSLDLTVDHFDSKIMNRLQKLQNLETLVVYFFEMPCDDEPEETLEKQLDPFLQTLIKACPNLKNVDIAAGDDFSKSLIL
jgi:hypothetical protein